jgi:hypothetical protein
VHVIREDREVGDAQALLTREFYRVAKRTERVFAPQTGQTPFESQRDMERMARIERRAFAMRLQLRAIRAARAAAASAVAVRERE